MDRAGFRLAFFRGNAMQLCGKVIGHEPVFAEGFGGQASRRERKEC